MILDEKEKKERLFELNERIKKDSLSKKERMILKIKRTKLIKYNDEFYNNRNKYKKTCLEKYGVDNSSKNKEIQDKWKKTNKEKYGCENVFQNEKIKEKIKETNLKNHGVEFPSQSKEIRNKIINKWIKTLGVKHPSQSEIIKKQKKQTCLDNYGVEYPSQIEGMMNKILDSRKQNRRYNLTEYQKYRVIVDKLTYKNKKELFEKWDGYDYYDKEYIKNNFNLTHNDKKYPTIDHKISVFYCFENNINVEVCANLENLCITKRSINSQKNRKIETEFNNSL